MSNAGTGTDCGCEPKALWPTPGRIARMTFAQYEAACFPVGVLVRVTDGECPGLYLNLGDGPQIVELRDPNAPVQSFAQFLSDVLTETETILNGE